MSVICPSIRSAPARNVFGLLTLAFAVALGVSACETVPDRDVEEPTAAEAAKALERRAEALVRNEDFAEAARLYARLAKDAEPPRRQILELRAAENLFAAQQLEQAEEVVTRIDEAPLDAAARTERRILAGRIALARNAPQRALAVLEAPSGQLTAALVTALHRLRAQAYHAAGDPIASVHERIALGQLLGDQDARRANSEALFRTLNELPEQGLETLREQASDALLRGWIQLARLARTPPLETQQFREALSSWQQHYPDHPGNAMVEGLLAEYRQNVYRPTQIALLLPLHGRLTKAAEAVRDGFLAAYYADDAAGAERPIVRVYDIGEDPSRTWSAYQRAVDEGADFVIGPLSKAATRSLAEASRLDVPTLALNALTGAEAGSHTPETLYQFALLPEDEARQAAAFARTQGHERALMLVPEGEWGTRLAEAFDQEFRSAGGTVLASRQYDPRANDYSTDITTLLNLDESEGRYERLRRHLGRAIEFEPRRRKDADLVFLAAFPRQGRLIRPQLRFHRASSLPVYATSHVYSGHAQAEADDDMDGIVFCDTPWTLLPQRTLASVRKAVLGVHPAVYERYPRLYAMGADAYNIVPYLKRLERDRYRRYSGATGRLYMDSHRRLHRGLVCAQFEDGRPNVTETTVPTFTLTGTEDHGETTKPGAGPPQRDTGSSLSPTPGAASADP